MAFAQKYRLTAKAEYQNVFKKGKTVKNSFFFFRYLANTTGRNRCGIIVPISVSKKAVVRNKIRRTISEIMKERILEKGSLDIVITASPTILDKSYEEIKGLLDTVTKKIFVND